MRLHLIVDYICRVEARNLVLANLETNETVAAVADGKTKRVGEMPAIGSTAIARYAADLSVA